MLNELFFDFDHSGRRGHSKKLIKRRSRLDIRKFAFSNRIVDRWNSLSECCRAVVVFKTETAVFSQNRRAMSR